jgi:hypothetical protein
MRARNIKPGFFKNPDLADAGPAAQLLCIGLWCMADKEGRLKDQPRVIKAEVFPYYEIDVNRELTVIQRLGHIRRFEVGGIKVIEVINFRKHQSPHHTERGSELPEYDGVSDCFVTEHEIHGEVTVNSPLENGGNPSDSLIPDSLIHLSKNPPLIPPLGGETKLKSSRKKIGTRLPDDWCHDVKHERLANEMGVVFYDELMKFRDYWKSEGRVKADWDATFCTWLRNAGERRSRNQSWSRK